MEMTLQYLDDVDVGLIRNLNVLFSSARVCGQ